MNPPGWADWASHERPGWFICWAEPPPERSCEDRYAVIHDGAAVRWARIHPNPEVPVRLSGGAFYEDMAPGGAVEAAAASALLHKAGIRRLLDRPGSAYETRVGGSRRMTSGPAFDLAYVYRPDDGACWGPELREPWPEAVPCPDCARRGHPDHHVVWWEAAFAPGHRLCLWCGSHWSLGRVEGDTGTHGTGPGGGPLGLWVLRRARFYRHGDLGGQPLVRPVKP